MKKFKNDRKLLERRDEEMITIQTGQIDFDLTIFFRSSKCEMKESLFCWECNLKG